MNENGEVEELKEIIDDEQPSEIDEETGKKKPKIRKYINKEGKVYEMEPSEEDETKKPSPKKAKEKKIKEPII